jgi:MOSC domain-containing protein YiiM
MRLEAVSLGRPKTIVLGTRSVETGIDKQPVPRAFAARLGLRGDTVADQINHGGPDQAVYLYGRTDYSWWESELGVSLAPGTFGENLTVSELDGDRRPGDRLRIGNALLELTSPRIPCAVFADRMNDRRWVKRFRDAERPGAYSRVLEEGEVQVGDAIELTPAGEEHPTLLDLFRLHYDKAPSLELVRRALEAPIAVRERESLEGRLEKLAANR